MKSLLQGFNSSFKQQKKDAVNLYIGKAKSPYVMNTKRKKKNRENWKKKKQSAFMRAMSGETTRHRPSVAMAGTWKHTDLPPPVGIRARVSFFCSADFMISSCIGRKESYPQYFFKMPCIIPTNN